MKGRVRVSFILIYFALALSRLNSLTITAGNHLLKRAANSAGPSFVIFVSICGGFPPLVSTVFKSPNPNLTKKRRSVCCCRRSTFHPRGKVKHHHNISRQRRTRKLKWLFHVVSQVVHSVPTCNSRAEAQRKKNNSGIEIEAKASLK